MLKGTFKWLLLIGAGCSLQYCRVLIRNNQEMLQMLRKKVTKLPLCKFETEYVGLTWYTTHPRGN